MSTWSHFRPWICSSVEKIFRSFTAILLRFIKFVKRTWQYHFLANRLKQRWAHEETYHHINYKLSHLIKFIHKPINSLVVQNRYVIVPLTRLQLWKIVDIPKDWPFYKYLARCLRPRFSGRYILQLRAQDT